MVHGTTPLRPLLNQLQSNIRWTQLDNLYSVPTDCDQRNERQVRARQLMWKPHFIPSFTSMRHSILGRWSSGRFTDPSLVRTVSKGERRTRRPIDAHGPTLNVACSVALLQGWMADASVSRCVSDKC